jgi:regulator of protease activity HflC (stomatin/prohibitin superfamily)
MQVLIGCATGLFLWFFFRVVLTGIYTVGQNERAVIARFGHAERIPGRTTLDNPIAQHLSGEERSRYVYPQVRVIQPGGPYLKLPWEKVHKVRIATATVNMALDPEDSLANQGGTHLDAVTKDHLNTGLTGQIRYRVSERNSMRTCSASRNPSST